MMSLPLSAQIRAHLEVTPDGDARAVLEGWVARAEVLESADEQGKATGEHRAAGLDELLEVPQAAVVEFVRLKGLGDAAASFAAGWIAHRAFAESSRGL
jgi:hypothetical protein